MDPLNGNAPPNGAQGTGAPEALSEDRVLELVNKAITGRLQDYGRKQEKHLSSLLETFTSKLDEKFQGITQQQSGQEGSDGAKPQAIQEHPEFKGMSKRMQDLEARLRAADEEKSQLKAKGLDTQLRQKLAEELTKAGVDSKWSRHAIGLLVDTDKRVRWSEDEGRVLWRDDDGADLDLSQGLKAWAKSEDAKAYMPARGVAGSAGAPGSGQPRTTGDVSDDQAARLLMQHLVGA
jgi:hypothetical protein